MIVCISIPGSVLPGNTVVSYVENRWPQLPLAQHRARRTVPCAGRESVTIVPQPQLGHGYLPCETPCSRFQSGMPALRGILGGVAE